jgi:hypothetical protein
VSLEVSDTGGGLTKEECDRLFTPYYTTKQHGTGLGLAIVQSVISDHGGRISVESETGVGTSFHIHLPRWMPGRPGDAISSPQLTGKLTPPPEEHSVASNDRAEQSSSETEAPSSLPVETVTETVAETVADPITDPADEPGVSESDIQVNDVRSASGEEQAAKIEES